MLGYMRSATRYRLRWIDSAWDTAQSWSRSVPRWTKYALSVVPLARLLVIQMRAFQGFLKSSRFGRPALLIHSASSCPKVVLPDA